MTSNKVIYLNEDSQELTSNRDVESQFEDNTQFNAPGESNYSVGGKQDGGHEDGGDEDGGHEDGGHEDGGHEDGGDEDGGHEGGDLEDDGLIVEDIVNISNVKLNSENLEQDGGNGDNRDNARDGDGDGDYAQSVSSLDSGGSSVNTAQILELDPMYIRLTKFLQTGGDNNKNMADILLDISNSFIKLNENLENLSNKMTKLSLQQ